MPTTGRCNCSSITVTLDQLPPNANCKRSGAGPFSIVYVLDRSAVTVNDPESYLKTYLDNGTKTGNTVHRSFCGNCGSPVYSSMGPEAPKLILKGGLFDSIPAPAGESFPQDRPEWLNVSKA
ncbi:hypothetical protein N0V90_010631 [Kalmusia sp. IMI 367209]|nr:hypothetical protein N0V90_010631 [Kalmusia sp. IMI 367209]